MNDGNNDEMDDDDDEEETCVCCCCCLDDAMMNEAPVCCAQRRSHTRLLVIRVNIHGVGGDRTNLIFAMLLMMVSLSPLLRRCMMFWLHKENADPKKSSNFIFL